MKAKKAKRRKKPVEKPIYISEEQKKLEDVLKILHKKCAGRINGETKTLKQFKKEMKEIFDLETTLPIKIALILTIYYKPTYCTVSKTAWGYDYYIPKTREEEEKLKKETGYYD